MSTPVAKAALRVKHELRGVVVSSGLMDKTVKVRVGGSKWNKIVHKVRRLFVENELARLTLHSGMPILNTTWYTTQTPLYEPAMWSPSSRDGLHRNTNVTLSNILLCHSALP